MYYMTVQLGQELVQSHKHLKTSEQHIVISLSFRVTHVDDMHVLTVDINCQLCETMASVNTPTLYIKP